MDYHAVHGYDIASFDAPGTRQSCLAPHNMEFGLTSSQTGYRLYQLHKLLMTLVATRQLMSLPE